MISSGPAALQASAHLHWVVKQALDSASGSALRANVIMSRAVTVNSGSDMVKRLNEGWKMIRATVDIIRDGRALQEKQ